MKIAILGGTRFIGHHTAALALERGHRVWVLHRGNHPCEVRGAIDVVVDRDDPSALCEALRGVDAEALVDTRAMTRSQAECTALALKVFGLPAVVLSSVDVYAQFGRLNGLPGPEPEEQVTEDSPRTIPYPFRELGPHEGGPDYDKKEVEAVFEQAAAEGVAAAVLRLPGVYGARDPRQRFLPIVGALRAGATLPCEGGASSRMSHAHVRDVAHAILLAAERHRAGFRAFNVGEPVVPTMRERAGAIGRLLGVEARFCEGPVPPEFWQLGRLPNDMVLSTDRIRSELGFCEITAEEERPLGFIEGATPHRGEA